MMTCFPNSVLQNRSALTDVKMWFLNTTLKKKIHLQSLTVHRQHRDQLCFDHDCFWAMWSEAHHFTSLTLVLLMVRRPHMAGVEGSRRISVLHLPLTLPRLTHIHDFLQQHLCLSVLGLGQSRRGRKVMPSRAAPLVADQCLWICPRLHCPQI